MLEYCLVSSLSETRLSAIFFRLFPLGPTERSGTEPKLGKGLSEPGAALPRSATNSLVELCLELATFSVFLPIIAFFAASYHSSGLIASGKEEQPDKTMTIPIDPNTFRKNRP